MKRKFKQFSILAVLVVFLFSLAPDIVESRRGGRSFGRSRSFSRSSTRRSYSAPKRSTSSTRSRSSTSRSYSTPRSSTRTTRSTGSTYSRSSASRSTGTRASTTARQKQTATSRAKATTATNRSTTASRSQQRATTGQNRKQVRQLKAQNRTLKRQVRTANRQTARARRDRRSTITVNNFGGYYPMMGYSIYSMQASMMFNNLMFGIYFHDYYNHAIQRSYLWHYHHPKYDRSHWSAEKQEEYEFYRDYYESQGVEPNSNYVDPGTNRDEDYVASYVEENPDEFYGDNAEVYTVDELPDEAAIKQELLAAAEATPTVTTTQTRAPPTTRTVYVEKKTSGATWFVLIFGSLIVVGVIVLVMYNKGYF